MPTKKIKNRLIIFFILSCLLVSVIVFSIKTLEKNVLYFLSPTEIKMKQNINFNKKIRIGGMVKRGSILVNNREIKFVVTDLKNEIIVSYRGTVPNLFLEGKGVIAEGQLKDKKFFIAKKILATLGVNISAGVVQIGDIQANKVSLEDTANNDFNFVDTDKISELETFFQALIKDQDSVGAKILVRINGLMPGVGSPVFSKLDAELAKAMMGVNAVKAVEIGAGANVVPDIGLLLAALEGDKDNNNPKFNNII